MWRSAVLRLTAVNRGNAAHAQHFRLKEEGLPPRRGPEPRMPQGDGGSGVDAGSVDAAIAQVLQAERDAREDVQRCALAAEAMAEQAQERAREIARRAASRSVRVQRWSAATLQQRLDALAERQAQSTRHAAQADAPDQLRVAVEALAAQLTGAGR